MAVATKEIDDLLDLPETAEVVPLAKLEPPALTAKQKRDSLAAEQHERLSRIRTEIHERSAGVVDAALRFAEIDPEAKGPPQEWVDELGPDLAMKRFRVAQAAWLNGKQAPAGIKVATDVMLGLEAAKARENAPVLQLNVGRVEMNFEMPVFEEEEVVGDG